MKRKIVIVVLLAILVSILATSATAAGKASLSVSSKTTYRGSSIKVVVRLSGIGTGKAGFAVLSYGNGLEWIDAVNENENVSVSYDLDKKRVIFFAMSDINFDGALMSLTFKVKNNAAFTDNKINIQLEIDGKSVSASSTITVACNHKWSAWAQWSATTHYHKCSVCGKTETPAHDFDNPCDTACNTCGFTRSTTHQFSQEWTADETGHWHGCVHCGEKSDFVEHTPGEEAGEYTDQVCIICNYVIISALGHQHRYDETYQQDAGQHWQICLGCGEETEHIAHEYSDHCDDVCNGCGYVRRVLHNEQDHWTNDSQDHWKVCDDCGDKVYFSEHLWGEGEVTKAPTLRDSGTMAYRCGLCQRVRIEEIPALTFSQAVPWWGFLLMGLGGGAGIAVGAIALTAYIKTKKKGEGKFSDSRAEVEW